MSIQDTFTTRSVETAVTFVVHVLQRLNKFWSLQKTQPCVSIVSSPVSALFSIGLDKVSLKCTDKSERRFTVSSELSVFVASGQDSQELAGKLCIEVETTASNKRAHIFTSIT